MQELKQLQQICMKHSNTIKKMILFGSRARGDSGARSDFDIAIYLLSKEYQAISEDIEDINTLLKIDVTFIYDENSLDSKFLENIKKEGVVLFMGKLENRYDNYKKAVARLAETLEVFHLQLNPPNTTINLKNILRDSLIQRFEFCYELAWKTLKELLIKEGIEVRGTPKAVFKLAYQYEYIHHQDIWLKMIQDRNLASHEYNENYIEDVAKRIEMEYYQEFTNLQLTLKENIT